MIENPVGAMSYRDLANRRRWAVEQKAKARAAFVPEERQEMSLAQLREYAALLEAHPNMIDALASVRAKIAKLETA